MKKIISTFVDCSVNSPIFLSTKEKKKLSKVIIDFQQEIDLMLAEELQLIEYNKHPVLSSNDANTIHRYLLKFEYNIREDLFNNIIKTAKAKNKYKEVYRRLLQPILVDKFRL